ncbi:phage tail length tape measure family protein [Ensifer adhaerens]|uniref:phage tail length tape measure family protein n=1 Tax=Ensifer adhaerens TaxID=106592 RepID=UPI0015C31F53|nr:phage tail length tape measure family protein [Ensifer adhaerens]
MAANDDTARLLVSIEATHAKFEKQLASVAKAAERAARNTESAFQSANDNIGKGFDGAARKVERSTGAQRAAVSNLSAQLNDIGVQLASGTSPFTVMVQQGSQVSAALQGSGGLVGAVKTLGGAFTQLVNPVSLASFALIGLAGYAVQYFTSVEDGAADSDKALKAHADLIAAVAKEWGDAVPSLKAYAEAAKEAQNVAQLREATDLHIEKILAEARAQVKGLSVDIASLVADLRAAGASDENILRIQDAFKAVQKAAADGGDATKQVAELQTALNSAWLDDGVPAAQALKAQLDRIADAYAEVAKRAAEAKRQSESAIGNRALNDPRTWRSFGRGDFQNADGTIQGSGTILPDNGPTPASRPLIELDGLGDAAGKAADSFEGLDGAVRRYVDNVVKAESGGNASAKNPNSSATGVGQFIETTWLNLFKKHFPDRAQNMADATILALREDADISKALIEAYARENAGILRQAGVSVNEAALQLAHFLGPQGAVSVLTAKSGTPVSQVLGQGAIAANPSILGGGATVDDVIAYAQRRTQAVQGETAAVHQLNDAWAGLRGPTDAHTQAVNQQSQAYDQFGQIAQSAFQGLANALADGKLEGRELLQIVMQLVQQLFSMPGGGFGGGGGGFFGSLLGGIFGFANGGVASNGRPQPLKTFARGGVSRTAAIFGEAGPEAAVPLPDGRNIPVKLMEPRVPRAATKSNDTVTIVLQDDSGRMADIADQRIQTASGTIVKVAVSESGKRVVPTMAKYQSEKSGGEWR